jgi:glutamate 5-kinase
VPTREIRKQLLSKVHRVVIKLGSYVLTTPTWKLDRKVFSDIVDSVVHLRERDIDCILVSSGAIASGVGRLGLKTRPRHLEQEQAAAAIGQIRLMGLYDRLFTAHAIPVAQILLTHGDLRDRRRFVRARQTLNSVLEYGAVPIINENDTTVVDEIKFGDNDYLSSLVTNLAQADLLVILTDIDGFYDSDPRRNPEARFIELLENIDDATEKLAVGTKSSVGRGGMATKLKAARTAASFGIPTIIANGKKPGMLRAVFDGDAVGTLILPQKNKLTGKKHWIAYTLKSQGTLVVDDGARDALEQRLRSLLPSGIVAVEGDFEAGECVTCRDLAGREFARGLTAYSSGAVDKIKGLKTVQISAALGCPVNREVIHRDDLVVFSALK